MKQNRAEKNQVTLFHKDSSRKLWTVKAVFEEEFVKARFEFISDRNNRISRLTDIASADPDKTPGAERYDKNIDVWFPVVDLDIEPGMYGKAEITGAETCKINGFFRQDVTKVEKQQAFFRPEALVHWENGLLLPDKSAKVETFSVIKEVAAVPTVSCQAFCSFQPLSEEWGGTINVTYQKRNGEWENGGKLKLDRERDWAFAALGGKTKEEALNLSIEYIFHSFNESLSNPYCGGIYLFYDCDADTYRNGQWPWSWGPAIRLLLECAKLSENNDFKLHFDRSRKEMEELALKIGLTTLKFQINNENHRADGFGTTRYTVRNFSDTGYEELINTGSDTGFLCGWGWLALYRQTKDERFLTAASQYLEALEEVLKQFAVPPQEWLPAPNSWTTFTIDESGFGTEGIEAVFQVTGQARYQKLCETYMEKHLSVFERTDGLWERQYQFDGEKVEPTAYMTRGMGWAMEGLLAAHRCMPGDGRYLAKAVKMADAVIRCQEENGSWQFYFAGPLKGGGAADKGTALWSLLLYMLYEETGEKRHLDAAKSALNWCLSHQYTGNNPHARGAIISQSGESGVTYRAYFRLCCQYTTSFMGLAILKDLGGGKRWTATGYANAFYLMAKRRAENLDR